MTTGATGLSQASAWASWRAARSARVITPQRVGGRMKRWSESFELQKLSDLSDDELAAAYTAEREPWLRVNFVSTVDGAAQGSDGVSKSINNDADKRVFDALRARADCLVVGAGTLRTEGYDVPRIPLVVVSRSADLPPTLRDAPPGRILMATIASADGLAAVREELGEDNVLVLGERRDRPGAAQGHAGRAGLDRAAVRGRPVAVRRPARRGRRRRAVLDGRADPRRRRRRTHRHRRRGRGGAASRPAAGAGRDAAGALARFSGPGSRPRSSGPPARCCPPARRRR